MTQKRIGYSTRCCTGVGLSIHYSSTYPKSTSMTTHYRTCMGSLANLGGRLSKKRMIVGAG